MSNNIYKILFLISVTRINRKGLVPIICRITYKNERKPFATGLFIKPNEWYSKSQLAKPPNEDNNFINAELSLIKNKINQAFLFLQVQGLEFDVEDCLLPTLSHLSVNNVPVDRLRNRYSF